MGNGATPEEAWENAKEGFYETGFNPEYPAEKLAEELELKNGAWVVKNPKIILLISHCEGVDKHETTEKEKDGILYEFVEESWRELYNPPKIESLSQSEAIDYYFENHEEDSYQVEDYDSDFEEDEDDEDY